MDENAMTRDSEAAVIRPQPRPVRAMLRDRRVFDANLYCYAGDLLPRLLAVRERFVNLTQIRWHDDQESRNDYLSVRVAHILWIGSTDGQIPLAPPRETRSERPVRVHLEGGGFVDAVVHLSSEYRISDFFENAGDFVPLHRPSFAGFRDIPDGIAVQQNAILAVADLGGPLQRRSWSHVD